jgi:hypothetical protein
MWDIKGVNVYLRSENTFDSSELSVLKWYKANSFNVEISGHHGGEYEDDCLLGCCAV